MTQTWESSSRRSATNTIPLTQAAADGALGIYVDGNLHGETTKMLFGLKMLREASPAQMAAAIHSAEARHQATRAEIESMFGLR